MRWWCRLRAACHCRHGLPVRFPSTNSSALRPGGELLAGSLGDNLADALEVDHPAEFGLVDLDLELFLERGKDLDGTQRVRAVILVEQTGVADLVLVKLKNVAHDLFDPRAPDFH